MTLDETEVRAHLGVGFGTFASAHLGRLYDEEEDATVQPTPTSVKKRRNVSEGSKVQLPLIRVRPEVALQASAARASVQPAGKTSASRASGVRSGAEASAKSSGSSLTSQGTSARSQAAVSASGSASKSQGGQASPTVTASAKPAKSG